MYLYCKNNALLVTDGLNRCGRDECHITEFVRAGVAERNTLYVDYTGCSVAQIIDALATTQYLELQGLTFSDRGAVSELRQEIIDFSYRPTPPPDKYAVRFNDMLLDIFYAHEIPLYADRYGFRAEDIQPSCQIRLSRQGGELWIEDVHWVLEAVDW